MAQSWPKTRRETTGRGETPSSSPGAAPGAVVSRQASPCQSPEDLLSAAAPDLDDDHVVRIWSAVWLRARRDARGIGATAHERRDAQRWFHSGAATDLLVALGVPQERAERLVAVELEAINNSRKARR